MEAVAPVITFATEYIVGDDEGWKVRVDYQDWADIKQFFAGDTF
ncbi:Cupredoxin [Corchorus olitorius]|uniref:Cupredoxin n=1 Tax=Corchorus olitorius TaxID=93759 RepID=A0A1R3HJG9_9ROSI|nr:Cupredoxin [Corchorus olitorius]